MGVVAIVVSLGVAAWTTARLARASGRLRILDHPNARSLHAAPTPRTGGLGVWTGLLAGGLLLAWQGMLPSPWGWVLVALLLQAPVAFLDDLRELSPPPKLLSQFAAATVVVAGLLPAPGGPWGWLLAAGWLFWLIWMTNLYNFMDGLDGLAGSQGVSGFAFLGLLFWQGGDPASALFCGVVAAASGGFLFHNLPPARIFLGDVGSTTLGLLAGVLGLLGVVTGHLPLPLAWLPFLPFLVDATWTLAARGIRGESVWRAHKEHLYQRLAESSVGRLRTLRLYQFGMVASGTVAWIAGTFPTPMQWIVAGFWVILYLAVFITVNQKVNALQE